MSNFNSIIMKSKISMLLFVAAFAAACTNEMEEFAKDSFENVPENASLTRSCLSDTIDLGELVSLEETEELKELKARYEKMYSNNRKVQALDATVDDFFSSNIYAIRELPVTIKVRTVASGSTTSNSSNNLFLAFPCLNLHNPFCFISHIRAAVKFSSLAISANDLF